MAFESRKNNTKTYFVLFGPLRRPGGLNKKHHPCEALKLKTLITAWPHFWYP